MERIVKALVTHGHNVTTAATEGPGQAGAIAREHIARGVDLIIAAGGDGTINEVAEGMAHSQIPMAILPCGTANVLACELKLTWDLVKLAERLRDFVPKRISLGHVTCDEGRVSRHFVLMAGIGLDAHIVYNLNADLKSQAGKLAYWIAGGSMIGKQLPQIHAEAAGRKFTCSFALLSKVKNYGGDFEIAREVNLFDNRFEAVLFEGRSSARYLKYLLAMIMNRLGRTRGVTVIRTDTMKLSGPHDDRVYVQIDGEFAGRLPAEIHVVHDALTLLLPPEYS